MECDDDQCKMVMTEIITTKNRNVRKDITVGTASAVGMSCGRARTANSSDRSFRL